MSPRKPKVKSTSFVLRVPGVVHGKYLLAVLDAENRIRERSKLDNFAMLQLE